MLGEAWLPIEWYCPNFMNILLSEDLLMISMVLMHIQIPPNNMQNICDIMEQDNQFFSDVIQILTRD